MSAKKIGTSRQVVRVVIDPEHYGKTAEAKAACMAGLAAAGISEPNGRRKLQEHAAGWVRGLLENYRKKGAEILELRESDDRLGRYRAAVAELAEVTGKAEAEIGEQLELANILIAEPSEEMKT